MITPILVLLMLLRTTYRSSLVVPTEGGINSARDENSLTLTREVLVQHNDVNVLGPAEVTTRLASHLRRDSVVMTDEYEL